MDAHELRAVLNEVLDEREHLDPELHEAHHMWIADRIECSRRRRAILDKVAQHVLGWSAVAGAAWLGAAILKALRGVQ